MTTYISGCDVSHFNGRVEWLQVAASSPIKFAIAKATEGASYVDSEFGHNWTGVAAAALTRGAYHFFRPAMDVEEQARHFLSVVGSVTVGDILALDLEETSNPKYVADEWPLVPSTHRLGLVLRWLEIVEDATKVRPVIYTRKSWIDAYMPGAAELVNYKLWVADYGGREQPRIPKPWNSWHLWQHGNGGIVPGISGHVDVNWVVSLP